VAGSGDDSICLEPDSELSYAARDFIRLKYARHSFTIFSLGSPVSTWFWSHSSIVLYSSCSSPSRFRSGIAAARLSTRALSSMIVGIHNH
jgi:hypothetical protein